MHNIKQQMGFLDVCHHHICYQNIVTSEKFTARLLYMMVLVVHLFMVREMTLRSTINLSSDCIHSIETT